MSRDKLEILTAIVGEETSLTLIERVKTRDEEAWAILIQLYSPSIRQWCHRLGVRKGDEEDIIQEVMRSVIGSVSRFEKSKEQGSFKAWLWTIARNKIRDYYNARALQNRAVGGTEAYLMLQAFPEAVSDSISSSLDETSVTQEALRIIRNEVQERTFNAFWRSTIDGLPPDMVAKEVGMSVDSVYQAKARILRRLRELLT